jgi:structure-specific recognition protein 1
VIEDLVGKKIAALGQTPHVSSLTLSFDPLDVSFSGDAQKSEKSADVKPTASQPASIEGLSAAPDTFVCKIAAVPSITPKGKVDIYICSDTLVVGFKNLFYRIPLTALQAVCSVPDPNGEEHSVCIALSVPLLVGKTRVPMVCLRVDRLAEPSAVDAGDATGPVADAVAEARATLATQHPETGPRLVHVVPALLEAFLRAAGAACGGLTRPDTAFRSHAGNPYVQCYFKATDGPLYPLRGGMLYLGKPMWLPAKHIASVDAVSRGERSFDLKVCVDSGAKPVTHEFGLLASDEQAPVTAYTALLAKWRGDKDAPVAPAPAPVVAPPRGSRRSARQEVVASSLGHVRLIDDRDTQADSESEDFDDASSDESDEDEDSDGYADDDDQDVMEYEDDEPAAKKARFD